jgi:class 3 adenylate cyclase
VSLTCPNCSHDNRDGAKFCDECGTKLPRSCGNCGNAVAATAKFCDECGTKLDGTLPPRPAVPAKPEPDPEPEPEPEPPGSAERRQLTVMFCDLVGFTKLTERLDPEDLTTVVRDYQRAVVGVIERYDGYVARYFGDGVMAYFCYPRAHEDNAERAVRAGLDIVAAVSALPRPDADPLQVRIGVATGRVVVGEVIGHGESAEREVMGVTPNLAARLQSLAGEDEIVISPRTHELLGASFDCEDLGEHAVKGIAAPVRAWRARGIVDAAAREEELTSMVGRDEELGLLRKRWRQTRDGDGRAVLLVAEAGLGKSRLMRGFLRSLDDDDHYEVRIACSPYHEHSPFFPITERLRLELALPETEAGDALAARLRDLGLDEAEIGPPLATLLGIEPPPSWPPYDLQAGFDLLQRALAAYHRAAARGRPTLIAVEDTHWIDPSTREFVKRLSDDVAGTPAMLLATTRPVDDGWWSGRDHVESLRLSRLSVADVRAMMEQLTDVDPTLGEEIARRADGVPLFVEELARAIVGHEGEAAPVIPATLEDPLMARLDALGAAKESAQLAATIGRSFDLALLKTVSRRASVDDDVAQLVASGLVLERAPNERYEFKHALIRDAAYESQLKKTRQALHARIAHALVESFADRAEEQPEQVAQHYRAGNHAAAAATWFERAARKAAERSANPESVDHYRAALFCLERADPPDELTRLRLLLAMSARLRLMYAGADALVPLAEAETIALAHDRRRDLAETLILRSQAQFATGDIDGCRESLERALPIAVELDDKRLIARTYGALGDADYLAGRMVTSVATYRRCLAACGERDDCLDIETPNLGALAFAQLFLLETSQSVANCERSLQAATRAGNNRAAMIAEVTRSIGNLHRGHYDVIETQASRGLALAERIGARIWIQASYTVRAEARFRQGARDLDIARRGVELTLADGGVFNGPWALAVLALVTDDDDERARCLARGHEILEGPGPSHNALWFHRYAIQIGARDERWHDVERSAAVFDRWADEREPVPWPTFFGALGRQLVAWARGERDDQTRAALVELREQARAFELVVEHELLERTLA